MSTHNLDKVALAFKIRHAIEAGDGNAAEAGLEQLATLYSPGFPSIPVPDRMPSHLTVLYLLVCMITAGEV